MSDFDDDPVPPQVCKTSWATVIRVVHGSLGFDEGGVQLREREVLLPAEAARRLGVPTKGIVQGMYERKLPRVRLDDGTLGVPADGLADFERQST